VRTLKRFFTGGYCGWKRTMRQAHSTSAARNRGLPRLVTLPDTLLVPRVCSPGHRPVYELMARRLVKRSHEQISRVMTTVVNSL